MLYCIGLSRTLSEMNWNFLLEVCAQTRATWLRGTIVMKLFSELSRWRKRESGEPDIISNVTSPWMWGLLLGFTICLAAVIYWGFFGTLVDSVSGTGVVIRAYGIHSITAKTSGTVEYLDIKPGSVIVPNQILGRIYNPEVFFNIHKLQVEQKELQERTQKIQAGTDALFRKRKDADQQKNKLIQKLLALMEENRRRLHELVDMQKMLRDKGISSKVDYYNVLSQNVSNENAVANTLITQLQDLYEQDESAWQQEENRIKLQGELFAKQQEVEFVLKSNQEQTWLRSDFKGIVLELLKHSGDPVTNGETIAIASAGGNHAKNIRLIAYVPAVDGKKVRPGMSVYFSPSALRAADYGYIKGVVASVSLFPVSCDSISAELKNRDFANTLTQSGTVMRVEVDFLTSDQTRSGLQWTSRYGSTATVETGMVGSLLINTEYRRPVSYILPYLREHLFGIGKEQEAK